MYALVFWLKTKQTSIVKETDLNPIKAEGETTMVYYNNRTYKAKIMRKSYDKEYLQCINITTDGEIKINKKRKNRNLNQIKQHMDLKIKKKLAKNKTEETTNLVNKNIFNYRSIFDDSGDEKSGEEERETEYESEQKKENKGIPNEQERDEEAENLREERYANQVRQLDHEMEDRESENEDEREEQDLLRKRKEQESLRNRECVLESTGRHRPHDRAGKQERHREEERERENFREREHDKERIQRERSFEKVRERERKEQKKNERESLRERERAHERIERKSLEEREREQEIIEQERFRENFREREQERLDNERERVRERERSCSRDSDEQDPLQLCREGGNGRVLLCDVWNVWIDKAKLTHFQRWRRQPKEMLRRLLKTLVGEKNLKNMCARGRSRKRDKIPEDIISAVEFYVNEKCHEQLKPVDITNVTNMMICSLRNPRR